MIPRPMQVVSRAAGHRRSRLPKIRCAQREKPINSLSIRNGSHRRSDVTQNFVETSHRSRCTQRGKCRARTRNPLQPPDAYPWRPRRRAPRFLHRGVAPRPPVISYALRSCWINLPLTPTTRRSYPRRGKPSPPPRKTLPSVPLDAAAAAGV